MGGEGKSKRAGKFGTKKSKERREEPLGTMSYQTSSKRSPPSRLLIGARKLSCFSAQSEARTAATVWNWSGKTLSSGALPYFCARLDFPSHLPLGLRGWVRAGLKAGLSSNLSGRHLCNICILRIWYSVSWSLSNSDFFFPQTSFSFSWVVLKDFPESNFMVTIEKH